MHHDGPIRCDRLTGNHRIARPYFDMEKSSTCQGGIAHDMVGQGLVIGIADWKCDDAEDPELGQARWEREPGTIVYASGSRLPNRWGAQYTTNNLAEGISLADSMSVIPDQCRSLTYTDSLVWYDLTAKTRPSGEAGLTKVRLRAQWRSQVDRIRLKKK